MPSLGFAFFTLGVISEKGELSPSFPIILKGPFHHRLALPRPFWDDALRLFNRTLEFLPQ